MPQISLKYIFTLLILCLGFSEHLVFNEEVFIFICFFFFFNIISVLASSLINQTFQEIGKGFSESFLKTSKDAKKSITFLIISKEQAFNSLLRVIVLLKIFRKSSIQQDLAISHFNFSDFTITLSFILSHIRFFSKTTYVLNFLQAHFMNAKKKLKSLHSK
jgi:hypothetical protein